MQSAYPLERMRRFRGRDEAIQVIGNREKLKRLLDDSSFISREDILKEIMGCYSGEAYGNAFWAKETGGWGDIPLQQTLYGDFYVKHKGLLPLSLDLGFITHLPEWFEENMIQNNGSHYLIMRYNFKKQLGTRTVWRGMMLSEEEAECMKTYGIPSAFLHRSKDMPDPLLNLEANVLSVYPYELLQVHFHHENMLTPFISVSSHPEIAIAVERHYGHKDPFKNFYLFQCSLPEIDLIYFTDHAIQKPSKLASLSHDTPLRVSLNNEEYSYPWDRNVESYVSYKINPEEIIEITKPSIQQSSWNGRHCMIKQN